MRVGLCNRMPDDWFEEFSRACAALGLDQRTIRIGDDDWMEQLEGIDIFVWRLVMADSSNVAEARAKIPIIEAMGIRCFPNAKMLWLYDDKIRETFFLRQQGRPTPRTWVFFERDAARAFALKAAYPMIVKSHCGAASGGVQLLRSPAEALRILRGVFREPPRLLAAAVFKYYTLPRLRKGDFLTMMRARYRHAWPHYAYFQEFLHIESDWRITTLGEDLVSVFVRKNRPGDFRASGSGIWEKVEEEDLPADACDLALEISNGNGFTSMTYDFMRKDGAWVIGELSYAFVLNKIYTATLFRRTGAGYRQAQPLSIGEMHLRAAMAQMTEVERAGTP